MLGHLSPEEQELIAETLQGPASRMTARERVSEAVVSAGFVAAVAGLWLAAPPGRFDVWPALICCVILVAALRVRVDTPFGFTVPTQLAFVPLLFSMPVALVPIAVVAASLVSRAPDILRGEMRPSRLVLTVGNSWFTIGPVAVFALAHVSPRDASPGLLVAALAAQFGVDLAVSLVRFATGRGAGLVEQLGETWVYVVDAALSGIALLVAEEIHASPIAVLAPLPLLGLVAMFARERRQRLESLLELNSAYRHARDEAVEASKLKSAFLANVSHEIRTPINGVMGMNDMLLETRLDSEQRGFAEQVARSSEHMLLIINDILDISQIETGRLDLDFVDFDLAEMIEQACAVADAQAQAKDLRRGLEIDPRLPLRVRGDSTRVRQVLMNLVANAVKFTSQGAVIVKVAPAGPPEAGRVRFEVVDSGIGVDPAILERMFEPFTQADGSTTRQYGGNGLGLAIAKQLVELMGGTIGAQSTPGVGSSFWFELVLEEARAPAAAPVREMAGARSARRGAQESAPLVLVVEDNSVNRLVAAHLLERCGFRSQLVGDGREALEALSMQRYDAVLMDCQMPGIDGYEATAELRRRELRSGEHTPVIAMTGRVMAGDLERCLAAGMDDCVTKPVRAHALAEVLGRWIAAGGDAQGQRAQGAAALAV